MILSADGTHVVSSHYLQFLVARSDVDANSYLTGGLLLPWLQSKQMDEVIIGEPMSPVRAQWE